jgi:pimeloyl-ACP methyl ester carboxylesterase
VTYDPRGVERSRKDEPTTESTPEQHADDVHAIIEAAAGGGPVDLFASSGGAVNALALVARHPGDVRTLVAHEPPLAALLPDRDAAFAATEDIRDTYRRSGMGSAMAKFIAIVTHRGPVPADFADRPIDPAMFGLPVDDDGSRTDPLVGQNIITCTHYEPDVQALRAAPTRIVVAVGKESDGELAHRGGEAIAERLGMTPAVFPDGHGGFLGGEYGQTGQPDAFAATLREVLSRTQPNVKQ